MERGNFLDRRIERAVLVGVITPQVGERTAAEYLDELEFLARTAGAQTIKIFTQKLAVTHRSTFVGQGKLEEIKLFCQDNEIDTVIFDDELTPSQLRNLERELQMKILDRTNLILDIFAARATTAYAKTQVELAQYQYLLPRLTGMWTHLERQRGGIGMRGPGETEIETDRRIIRDKISRLKEQLQKIDRQMATQRSSRGAMVRVALVGYTNVGKSTLMNLLSKSDILAENKLFATLDTTVRKVVIENLPFLLCDTVGFIRKLPTQLVEAFKSTLDEVREADLLLHVVDISHPQAEDQLNVVNATLQEIGAAGKPTYTIFNKIDAYTYTPLPADDLVSEERAINMPLEKLQQTYMARVPASIFVSAAAGTNMVVLKQELYKLVRDIHIKRYPTNSFLY
ncbi:MAG: GTPase HflX [Mucinivorans sp.]